MTSQERHILGEHDDNHTSAPRGADSNEAIQLREEELAARKKSVEAGRLSLGTDVVENQATLDVPVTREEVTIDRHPVDRRPSDEPITTNAEAITVPLREEQVSVDKQAVVYEEVSVGKRPVQETRRVTDTVRKEVMDVDTTGNVDRTGDSADRR